MVVGGWFPSAVRVAEPTVRTELAAVSIIFLVAGKAVAWCAFKEIVGMAFRTTYLGMRTG
mgnify:CR=1 FL=1